ncbi:MAG: class I SAM-dependent methyltransferase [Myxococcales bacterium]|nr:class I SAM-dependent methyltransferase [Myxococcales bacterium]
MVSDGDNLHQGYQTLSRVDACAPNYNAWIGRRLRPHCGRRVLEVGAGIGTITAQLEESRELVVALDIDPLYVERLKNRFRHKAHVRPLLADIANADFGSLATERIDTVVVSNVLEHIEDDAGAVRRFRDLLPGGGCVLALVPALPFLFGSLDAAVGHHRRYTARSLRALLEANGFSVERLEWMNLAGIPGWLLNGRLLRRTALPPLQLRLYDRLAPLIAAAEALFELPLGLSLFAVARKP